jgi:DNA processing protein
MSAQDDRFVQRLSATLTGVRNARTTLASEETERAHWASLAESEQEDVRLLAEKLHQAGVALLTRHDSLWPADLEDLPSPPPFLFARGDLSLLQQTVIGMCGSRSASERGLRAARTAGREAARNGMHIISGYAKGVDTETHLAALEEGAGTVVVLAEGINHFRIKRDFKQANVSLDRLLVLSQFAPGQRWTAGGAMTRNGIICALGKALVVIEAGEKGGTLNAGRQAIGIGRPVLALQFGDEGDADTPVGNQLLFREGARPVRSTGELRQCISALRSTSKVRSSSRHALLF